jgi:hypothetical protein
MGIQILRRDRQIVERWRSHRFALSGGRALLLAIAEARRVGFP